MKISKSAKILSTALAIAMLLCSLPLAFGASADTGATVLDYSVLEDNKKLHIADFRNLGMHDAVGLNIESGAAVPDRDWWWQLAVVDKTIENSSAYAIYDVAANTTFTANFTESTNVESMKFYVSENLFDWFVADTQINEKTASFTVPYYASYVKVVWPLGADISNGLTSLNFTKATLDANQRFVDVSANAVAGSAGSGMNDVNVLKRYGHWQSHGLDVSSGLISPSWSQLDAAKSENSYNGYLTYKVQPNTYFSLSTTVIREAMDAISAKLGHDFDMKIFVSNDNVNFEKLEVSPTYTAGYSNAQNGGDARRRVDYSFIVPDGMTYVKCVYPITQNLTTLKGKDGSAVYRYIGNDIIDVDKVEFTAIKYDYYKQGEGDYYIADTISELGISDYSNLENYNPKMGINIGYRVNSAYVTYDVVKNTAFYAGLRIEWTGGLSSYISQKGSYSVKLQGLNNSTWEDIDDITFNESNPYDGSVYFTLNATAEQNSYEKIRIYWNNPYGNDGAGEVTGNNLACVCEVAFTAPGTVVYDFTKCTDINTLKSNYGVLDYSTSENPIIVKANDGLVLDWNAVANAGAAGQLPKAYITYKVEAGRSFKVNFNKNGWYNNYEPLQAAWDDADFNIKAYTAASDTFENATEHAITYSDASNNYSIEFTVPTGEEYVKIEYPITWRIVSDPNKDRVPNEMFRITSVEIGAKAALVLNSAKADASKANTRYYKKDAINLNGLEIKLKYNTGEERTVDYGYTVQGYDADKLGQQTVTVSYGGCNSEVEVEVYAYNGDLNCDKKVDIVDFVRLKKIAVGTAVSDGASADINGDNSVNAADATLMKQYLTGNTESL